VINIHILPFRKDFNLWNIVYIRMVAQVNWMSVSSDGDKYSNNSPKVREFVCLLLLSFREGGNDVMNV
jgi:hypothetical protein